MYNVAPTALWMFCDFIFYHTVASMRLNFTAKSLRIQRFTKLFYYFTHLLSTDYIDFHRWFPCSKIKQRISIMNLVHKRYQMTQVGSSLYSIYSSLKCRQGTVFLHKYSLIGLSQRNPRGTLEEPQRNLGQRISEKGIEVK